MDQDIQTILLKISEELTNKEISAMIFLCGKTLKEGEKENIKDGMALFSNLKRKGLISKDNLLFLKELLSRTTRKDILKNVLKATESEMEDLETSFHHITKYRSLLYDISESLTSKETEKILFLLDKMKHTTELNKEECIMVFSAMEKQGKLSESELQMLNTYLVNIGRLDLSDKIKKFKDEQYNQSLEYDAKFEKLGIQEEAISDINVSSTQPDVQNDSSFENNKLPQYKLDKIPHGLCVIVNNRKFKEAMDNKIKLKDREGTQEDAEKIYKVFSSRDYTVRQHDDLTGEEILNIMKHYAKEDHTEEDSFVCFVLSHGDKGIVFGTDGKDVPVRKLTNCFNGKKCPSLIGKPKVFFIQACQGDKSDSGVPYVSDNSTFVSDNNRLPTFADFLTAFASVEDYESLRSTTTGSVYIQTLCTVLQDHQFFQTDLMGILTKVHDKIADEVYLVKKNDKLLKVKQMPSFHSELRKTLILPLPSNGQQAS